MINIYDYRTRRLIAVVEHAAFNVWCEAHGYLPHHKLGRSGWVVIG